MEIISISEGNKENLKKLLLSDFKTLKEWFYDNYMIINSDNFMCPGENSNYEL